MLAKIKELDSLATCQQQMLTITSAELRQLKRNQGSSSRFDETDTRELCHFQLGKVPGFVPGKK